MAVGPMHPASHGDTPPAHAPGNLNPGRKAKADARKAAAATAGARAMLAAVPAPADDRKGKALASRVRDAIAAFRAADGDLANDRFLDSAELAALDRALDEARAALAEAHAALDAHKARLDAAPGSPRWIRTAARLRDAADAEGYDFDAYGDDPADGYSGRGMYGAKVPALTIRCRREAEVVAARAAKVLGVPVEVDSFGLEWVVYPTRLAK